MIDFNVPPYVKESSLFVEEAIRSHKICGDGEFTITIKDRIVEGKAKAKTIQMVNQFIDEYEEKLMEIWEKAQRGEKIEKIKR